MFFEKGHRIIHPEFGDITDDVIAELDEIAGEKDKVVLEREQAEIAMRAGTVARDMKFGRMVAQIHPEVYAYWERREGAGFWFDKKNVEKFLRDNPSCKVDSKSGRTVVRGANLGGSPALPRIVSGRGKGRWA